MRKNTYDKNKFVAQAVVGYKDFFQVHFKGETFDLLKEFPTDLITLYLSKINAIIFLEQDEKTTLRKIISESFYLLITEPRIKRTAEIIEQYQQNDSFPYFFTPQAISKLLGISLANYRQIDKIEVEVNEHKFQESLWDTILIVNDMYYNSSNNSKLELTTYEGIWELTLRQQNYIRRSTYMNITGQVYVMLFYNFIKKKILESDKYINEFISSMGMKSFFEAGYYTISLVVESMNNYLNDGLAKHAIVKTNVNLDLIKPFSFLPNELQSGKFKGHIHSEIMTRPFYILESKDCIITDFYFLSYMAEHSLTYNFHRFSSIGQKENLKSYASFKGFLGKNFYEEYYAYKLLSNLFREPKFKLLNDERKYNPDYTIISGKDIFLIEVKSGDISLSVLEEVNPHKYKEYILSNYARKANNGSRNKGIFQLHKSIEKLLEYNYFNNILKPRCRNNSVNIFPIIIYVDSSLDIYGVNGFLNDLLASEVRKLQLGKNKVHPLTLINLKLFIDYYEEFKSNPACFKELILSYHGRCKSNSDSFKKNRHPYQFLRANISFSNYLFEKIDISNSGRRFRALVSDLELE